MLTFIVVLALVFLFAAVFYALYKKRYVRATFRGPWSLLVEFEAGKIERESEKDDQV